jgi:hypothetical protein
MNDGPAPRSLAPHDEDCGLVDRPKTEANRISVVHDSMLLLSKGLAVFNKRHSAARSALRFSVGSGHFGQEQVLQALRALALVLAHCDPLARLPIAG